MKVLIVTLRLGANYGGILQAYALQKVVRDMGHDVATTRSGGVLKRRIAKAVPGSRYILTRLKGKKYTPINFITKYTSMFVDSHIRTMNFDKARLISFRKGFGAYVVGSDQVWRKPYGTVLHNMLSFVRNKDAIRLSYAASFGQDNLDEYGDRLINQTRLLAKEFTAISVREFSGAEISKKYWGIDAEHHIDPTLLIDKKTYSGLIDDDKLPTYAPNGKLFVYVLDVAGDKQGIITKIGKILSLKPFHLIDGDENNGKPMPPVTQWLRSFRDAKYVVTDSFHGTVFSIIFNKPFIAIGNKERGLARFSSLLRVFGLEDRLVFNISDITNELLNSEINWANVNNIRNIEKIRSMDYLKKYLGNTNE